MSNSATQSAFECGAPNGAPHRFMSNIFKRLQKITKIEKNKLKIK